MKVTEMLSSVEYSRGEMRGCFVLSASRSNESESDAGAKGSGRMESQLLMAMSGLGVYCAGWVAASLVVDRLDVTLCSVTTSKTGQPRRMRNRPRSAHGLFPKGIDKLVAEAKRAVVYRW